MTYRTILALAQPGPEAAARLQIAAALAARTGAILDAVFVRPLFVPAPASMDFGGYIPPATLDAMIESHRAAVGEAEAAAQASFRAAVAAMRPRAEWFALEETSALGFVGLARRADLVVFPKSGTTAPRLGAMDLAHDAGAPLLLTPASPTSVDTGRRVLVAWNGSREAASALRAAWPVLEQAERVEVVMVDPPPEAEAFLGMHLQRHGIEAHIHIEHAADARAGEVIRTQAERLGADLVVMGLYGHSRLRELVLGGASRTMLGQEGLPLLVSR